MNGWLLDTNVVSEGRRPNPSERVSAFIAGLPLERMFLSVVNLAEFRFGIERASGSHRIDLERWLQEAIRPMFAGRILPLSEEVLVLWRLLLERGRKSGHTFPEPDLLLAATALQYDLTLVTRNARDFAGTGVRLFNPWDDPATPSPEESR